MSSVIAVVREAKSISLKNLFLAADTSGVYLPATLRLRYEVRTLSAFAVE